MSDLVKLVEEYPLPTGPKGATKAEHRAAIAAEVERILSTGGVRKLLVQFNGPIRVERFTERLESEVELPPPGDDLYAAVRNAPMEELQASAGSGALHCLMLACAVLTKKRLSPKALLAHSEGDLREWLGITEQFFPLDQVMCIPVTLSSSAATESVILVGSESEDAFDDVSFSIRIPIERAKKGTRTQTKGKK